MINTSRIEQSLDLKEAIKRVIYLGKRLKEGKPSTESMYDIGCRRVVSSAISQRQQKVGDEYRAKMEDEKAQFIAEVGRRCNEFYDEHGIFSKQILRVLGGKSQGIDVLAGEELVLEVGYNVKYYLGFQDGVVVSLVKGWLKWGEKNNLIKQHFHNSRKNAGIYVFTHSLVPKALTPDELLKEIS